MTMDAVGLEGAHTFPHREFWLTDIFLFDPLVFHCPSSSSFNEQLTPLARSTMPLPKTRSFPPQPTTRLSLFLEFSLLSRRSDILIERQDICIHRPVALQTQGTIPLPEAHSIQTGQETSSSHSISSARGACEEVESQG